MLADDWGTGPTKEQTQKLTIQALLDTNKVLEHRIAELENEIRQRSQTPLKVLWKNIWRKIEFPAIMLGIIATIGTIIVTPIVLVNNHEDKKNFQYCEFNASLVSTKYKVDPTNGTCYLLDKKLGNYYRIEPRKVNER